MSEESYSNDGGMVSDGTRRRRSSTITTVPKFKRMTKNVPRTEFGEFMGNLTCGMLFVFPVIALLIMSFPKESFTIIGLISLFTLMVSKSFKTAIIVFFICLIPVVLGFISIGFFSVIFS